MNQPQIQVSIIQQGKSWYEIYEGNDHSTDLCGSSLELVNFLGNAQKENRNYDNAYNCNWQS